MKFRAFILFFLLLGIVPDLLISLLYFPQLSFLWKGVICLPTLALFILLVNIGTGWHYTQSVTLFSYIIFIIALPKTLFTIVKPAGFWVALGLGLAVSAFFSTLIFYSTRHLKVNRVELGFGHLPKAFDGLKICQLTDMHLGSFGKTAGYIKRIVDQTLALRPDLILFTGDLVNFSTSEAEPYLGELARLKAPMGIFSIRGNHDYLMHGHHNDESRMKDTEKLLAMERGLGWNVLLNSNVTLDKDGEEIALVGVENVSSNPYFTKMGGDLKKALQGLRNGIFTILMSHDPSHWRAEVVPVSDIPLTLSGHTHGLGYKAAGPHISHWKLKESRGVYTQDGQVLHVSRGLGSAFAFRLGGFPNVDLITLKKN